MPDIEQPSKSWMNLGDSFEGKAALLSDAFDRWVDQMFPSAMVTGWVEATYPNFAVVAVAEEKGVGGPEHIEFWKLPYSIGDDDRSVTLGEPKSLDIRGVAVDRPGDPADDITFLPRQNVVAKALAYKSASRQRRHYALLAHQGVDIRPTGLTPEMLAAAPSGSSTIPDPSDPDYRSGQSDLTTPGAAGPSAANPAVPGQGSYLDDAGSIPSPDIPAWFQGTYYVDNDSNLVPSAVPGQGRYNEGLSTMPGTPLPDQGHYNDGANSNLPDPAPLSAVGQTRDAGSLTLAGRSAAAERKSLLRQVREQKYRIPGAPVAEPGTAASEVDARLLAALPDIAEKAVALAVAVKEGRVMSAANGRTLASLHSELGKALAAAGAPVDVYQPGNEAEGRDEEGVAITPQEAKGLSVDELMAFQRHQAEVARLAAGGAGGG